MKVFKNCTNLLSHADTLAGHLYLFRLLRYFLSSIKKIYYIIPETLLEKNQCNFLRFFGNSFGICVWVVCHVDKTLNAQLIDVCKTYQRCYSFRLTYTSLLLVKVKVILFHFLFYSYYMFSVTILL